jgi:hypothetical protein
MVPIRFTDNETLKQGLRLAMCHSTVVFRGDGVFEVQAQILEVLEQNQIAFEIIQETEIAPATESVLAS